MGPDVTDPVGDVTDPVTPASDPPFVGPGVNELLSMSFRGANDADFTLQPNSSHTITLNFDPSDWSGTVTWSSDNPHTYMYTHMMWDSPMCPGNTFG